MNKLKLKHKKLNTNHGITLVALIITIIVLLILAVVAIRTVKGDGIIAHAKNAKNVYEQKAEEENAVLEQYLANIESNVTKGKTATEAGVVIGDYVDYPVAYTNAESGVPSEYTGWRVLSVDGSTVRLVSAGIPLKYHFGTDSATTYNDLTSGISQIAHNNSIIISNDYTANVSSMTKEDFDTIYGSVTSPGEGYGSDGINGADDLIIIPNTDGYSCIMYSLAKPYDDNLNYYLLNSAQVTAGSDMDIGVRLVITLKDSVRFSDSGTQMKGKTLWNIS